MAKLNWTSEAERWLKDIYEYITTERTNERLLRKAISVVALPASWRGYFEHQLERLRE